MSQFLWPQSGVAYAHSGWLHPGIFIPSLAVLNLGGNIALLSRFRNHVDWRVVGFLVGGTILGVPIGILLLKVLSFPRFKSSWGLVFSSRCPLLSEKNSKGLFALPMVSLRASSRDCSVGPLESTAHPIFCFSQPTSRTLRRNDMRRQSQPFCLDVSFASLVSA